MAQGDVLQIDDKIQIDGDGKIRLVDADSDCPDCCGCTDDLTGSCSNCDDITPDIYRVTFSGISVCGCYQNLAGHYVSYSLNFNINSGFDLHRITGTGTDRCQWSYGQHAGAGDPAITVDFDVYDNASCAGTPLASRTNRAAGITINKAGTTHDLFVSLDDSYTIGSTGYGGQGTFLFYDIQNSNTNGADQLCATVPAFTNDSAVVGDCGSSTPPILGANARFAGYGGTATVVCL